MSEANILNPTSDSQLNPDYGYSEGLPELHDELAMDGGEIWTRQTRFFGRIYQLAWNRRDKATMHTLRQWEQQYRRDFFTFKDFERGRDFSGRLILDGVQAFTLEGNEQWNIRGRFIELVGKAMNAYPSDWTRDANFIEERDGSDTDLVALTGSWTLQDPQALAHGNAQYTATADGATAEWEYFGYGLRVWLLKAVSRGINELTVTRARDGVQVVAPTNIDQYAGSNTASAPLFTKTDLPLDRYFVKLRRTGTKNASATDFLTDADAIEVMR